MAALRDTSAWAPRSPCKGHLSVWHIRRMGLAIFVSSPLHIKLRVRRIHRRTTRQRQGGGTAMRARPRLGRKNELPDALHGKVEQTYCENDETRWEHLIDRIDE